MADIVEAYTASWIEIFSYLLSVFVLPVEAYTASWIEIFKCSIHFSWNYVEAYTASWIEIAVLQLALKERWSRGLYSLVDWNIFLILFARKIPVEAYTASWIEIPKSCSILSRSCVEAYTASWIEIIASNPSTGFLSSRGLYSLVDWNAEYTPQ